MLKRVSALACRTALLRRNAQRVFLSFRAEEGDSEQQQAEIPKVLESANKALQANPNDIEALGIRANIMAQQGDLMAALKDAEKAVELAPENPHCLALLGALMFYKEDSDKSQALSNLLRALENADEEVVMLSVMPMQETFQMCSEFLNADEDTIVDHIDTIREVEMVLGMLMDRVIEEAEKTGLGVKNVFAVEPQDLTAFRMSVRRKLMDVFMSKFGNEDGSYDEDVYSEIMRLAQCVVDDASTVLKDTPTETSLLLERAAMNGFLAQFDDAIDDLSFIIELGNQPDNEVPGEVTRQAKLMLETLRTEKEQTSGQEFTVE
ncbi:MAG: hypothetical protein MHM6MM_001743 [Cercozoa sp. M6MM]